METECDWICVCVYIIDADAHVFQCMEEAGVDGALIVQPINHKFDHSYVTRYVQQFFYTFDVRAQLFSTFMLNNTEMRVCMDGISSGNMISAFEVFYNAGIATEGRE